jgi:chromosome segregation ATPase
MDEVTSSSNAASAALDLYALAGEEGQRRASDFLAAQRAQLERLEAELSGHLDTLCADTASSATPIIATLVTDDALDAQRAEVREQLSRLRERIEQLDEREAQLQEEQRKLERAQQARAQRVKQEEETLERREQDLASAEQSLRQAQRALQGARDELLAEREQFAAEGTRLQERHSELDAELEKLEAERRRTQSQRRHIAHELQAQRASQLAATEKQRLALQRQQDEIAESQRELAAREQACEEAEGRLRQLNKELSTERQELQAEREQVTQIRKRLEEQRAALDAEHDKLATRQAQITQQGRRIAHKLKAQHASQQHEIERKRRELEAIAQTRPAEVDARLLTATAECQAMRDEIDQLRKALTDRAGDAARSREQVTTLTIEIETLRNEHDRLSQELAVRETAVAGERAKLESLQAERNSLIAQLAEAAANQGSRNDDSDRQRDDDMDRRHEMAVEEIRSLKRANAELEEKLSRAKSGQSVSSGDTGGKLDWEAQKRRLLQSLDDDFDGNDEEEADEKASIEDAIRKTDEALAQKEREIAELKQLLNEQSSNLGDVAVGAAAIAGAFDQDELIQQERQRLQQMQQECEEKLRKAEVDISLERAKIARERAEIDEKLQQMERQKAELGTIGEHGNATPAHPGKAGRGRWLTRLGLKDVDEQ